MTYQSWITNAVKQMHEDGLTSDDLSIDVVTRCLSNVIAAHAEQIISLLLESRREHEEPFDESIPGCRKVWDHIHANCDCGAQEWNRRVDEALK